MSVAGMSIVLAKSFPVPAAMIASRLLLPAATIAFATFPHVPSPPHATSVVAPSFSACAAIACSWPIAVVNRTSVTP